MRLIDESDGTRSLLSVQDAAKRLRVHPNTIYRLIQNGTLPALKRRGRWMIATDDVYRYSSGRNPWLSNLRLVRENLESARRSLESTQMPMGITDVEGYFLGINDAYRDVLGYSRSWFYTHSYLDYTAEEARRENEQNRLRALSSHGISVAYRKKAVTSSDRVLLIDFQVVASQLDADPQSALIICLATNIEET